jgi:ABC-type polar amino acid transport system ATPase subunit
METKRFPRLVADYFGTFEVVKKENGGSEDESFRFFDRLFSHPGSEEHSYITDESFKYEDFDYLVLQISQPGRNNIKFNYEDKDWDVQLMQTNEKEIRKNVGMVFQSYQLFNHLNLVSNIINPLMIVKKISNEQAHELAHSFLDKVGLAGHAQKYPHQLSGGQQQRGAIARALAMKPKVMLYDEPTSALDPELALEVHQVMKSIDHTMTQIIVTHEMRFARDISDEIIFMHQGSVGEIGTPQEIFSTPKLEATKEFLRNFL